MITDGDANVKPEATLPSAIALRNSEAFVIAIGVGTMVNMVALKNIASRPANRTVFTAMSWKNLPDIKTAVIASFCNGK